MTVVNESFRIGIPIYPSVDLMDVVGTYYVFSWLKSVGGKPLELYLVAQDLNPIQTSSSSGSFILTPNITFEECGQLNLIMVPGGNPNELPSQMSNPQYLDFLRRQSQSVEYICSVCVGAFLLAAAGLLDGFRATTHWAFVPCLSKFPQIKVVNGYPRYVIDRNRITGGGISSAIDEALMIVSLITNDEQAEQVQLSMQYSPQPPFNDGDPCSAAYEVYEEVEESMSKGIEAVCRAVCSAVEKNTGEQK